MCEGASPARVGIRPVVRSFEQASENKTSEQPESSARVEASSARVGPRRDTPPPGTGTPVLSSRGTVPSQMPLRRVVSHSETISAPGQCRTLERGLEAVYGPYSTSTPCTRHSTNEETRSTARRKPVRALTALSSGPPGVAILTVITRQKSHSARPISEAKEIGCYRVRGRGRGCDPADPHGEGHP